MTGFPEVSINVEGGEGDGGEGVIVDSDVFDGGVGGADEGVELDGDDMVLREVVVGGSVEEAEGAAGGVGWDLVAERGEVEGEAVAVGGFVDGGDGEGEAGGEVGECFGCWVVEVEGLGGDGSSDAEEVGDFVEVDGAVGGFSVTFVGDGGGVVVEVGDVEGE